MSRRPISIQYALAAQRRENEYRKAEEASKVAKYFDTHTKRLQHYETWTTEEYYEKARKAAEKFAQSKEKERKLEERRKKLEMLFYKENLKYQEEMKQMSSKPKLYQNGYITNTSTNKDDINVGILSKQEELVKREEALLDFHRSRTCSEDMEKAERRLLSGKPKQAWMDQIVEKVVEERKIDEDKRQKLRVENENLTREMQVELESLKEKEGNMEDLKSKVLKEMERYNELERRQKSLNEIINKMKELLDRVECIGKERIEAASHTQRTENKTKCGMFKYALKIMTAERINNIQIDLDVLDKYQSCMQNQLLSNDVQKEMDTLLARARKEIKSRLDAECERKGCIQSMYDGEARQLYPGQVKIWSLEQQSRDVIMSEVNRALRGAVTSSIERAEHERRDNLLQRERALASLDDAVATERFDRENEISSEQKKIKEIGASLKRIKLKEEELERRRKEEEHKKKEGEEDKNKRKILLDKNRKSRLTFF